MSEEQTDRLQPDEHDGTIPLEESESPQRTPPSHKPGRAEALPIESAEPDGESEPCPQCGAPMRSNDLVCIRCGYDLAHLEQKKTKVEPVEEVESALEEEAERGVLIRRTRFDLWLPATMAIVSGVILMIGYLAAAHGLYPRLAAEIVAAMEEGRAVPRITWGMRLEAVGRFVVLVGLLTGCGMAGLFLLAQALQRALGELGIAALRMLGIVTTMRLVTFIDLRWQQAEFLLEAALQAAAFVALCMALYNLKPRDAGMLGVFALMALLALWISARAIIWVTL
jgi:hypothetical protein